MLCDYSMLFICKNRRSVLSLDWHKWFSSKRLRMKYLLMWARVLVRTSSIKISRRHLADFVKKLHQSACRSCSTIIFHHSINHIIDLWRFGHFCHRGFLNSLWWFSFGALFHRGRVRNVLKDKAHVRGVQKSLFLFIKYAHLGFFPV